MSVLRGGGLAFWDFVFFKKAQSNSLSLLLPKFEQFLGLEKKTYAEEKIAEDI